MYRTLGLMLVPHFLLGTYIDGVFTRKSWACSWQDSSFWFCRSSLVLVCSGTNNSKWRCANCCRCRGLFTTMWAGWYLSWAWTIVSRSAVWSIISGFAALRVASFLSPDPVDQKRCVRIISGVRLWSVLKRLWSPKEIVDPKFDWKALCVWKSSFLVVFSDETDLWWLKFCVAGLSICFVVIQIHDRWVVIDPMLHFWEVSIPDVCRLILIWRWWFRKGYAGLFETCILSSSRQCYPPIFYLVSKLSEAVVSS